MGHTGYSVVTKPSEVAAALEMWRATVTRAGQVLTRTLTFPSGSATGSVVWVRQNSFWTHFGSSNDRYYWCPYGYAPREPLDPVNITIEINPPVVDYRRTGGRILRDREGRLFLAHKGGKSGGRGRQVTKDEFWRRIQGVVRAKAEWADGIVEELFLLGDVAKPPTIQNVANYVLQAEELAIEAKEGSRTSGLRQTPDPIS